MYGVVHHRYSFNVYGRGILVMGIIGFEIETEPITRVLIETETGTIIAEFWELMETNENIGMYLSDTRYYSSEIKEVLEQYLEEVNDYNYL